MSFVCPCRSSMRPSFLSRMLAQTTATQWPSRKTETALESMALYLEGRAEGMRRAWEGISAEAVARTWHGSRCSSERATDRAGRSSRPLCPSTAGTGRRGRPACRAGGLAGRAPA
eukprot:303104-Prymnesium_polylepis.1